MKYILNYPSHSAFSNNMPSIIPNIAYDAEHVHYNEAWKYIDFDLMMNLTSEDPINIIDPDNNQIIYQLYNNHVGPLYMNLNKTYIFRYTGAETSEYQRPRDWYVDLNNADNYNIDNQIWITSIAFTEYNLSKYLKFQKEPNSTWQAGYIQFTDTEMSEYVFHDSFNENYEGITVNQKYHQAAIDNNQSYYIEFSIGNNVPYANSGYSAVFKNIETNEIYDIGEPLNVTGISNLLCAGYSLPINSLPDVWYCLK